MLPVEREGTAAGVAGQLDTPVVLQQLSASCDTNAVVQTIDSSQHRTQGPMIGSCQPAAQPSRPWLEEEVALAGVDGNDHSTEGRRQEQELAEGAAHSLASSAVFEECTHHRFICLPWAFLYDAYNACARFDLEVYLQKPEPTFDNGRKDNCRSPISA